VRVQYMIPGPMGRSSEGAAEVARREALLRQWAGPGTDVRVVDSADGPASIESAYEDHLSVPPLVHALVQAERDGVDAMIIGCYDDPGYDAMRELASRTIVVGPAAASMHLAALLGTQLGIVTVPEPGAVRRLIYTHRLQEHVRDIVVIRSSVLGLREDVERSVQQVRDAGAQLIGAGADVIVLGCMSLAFLDLDERLSAELGVPIVNPAKAALGTAELLVRAGLRPSKLAYPTPTKIVDGTPLDEFVGAAAVNR
jgi:allantoin racemase